MPSAPARRADPDKARLGRRSARALPSRRFVLRRLRNEWRRAHDAEKPDDEQPRNVFHVRPRIPAWYWILSRRHAFGYGTKVQCVLRAKRGTIAGLSFVAFQAPPPYRQPRSAVSISQLSSVHPR